MVQISLDGVYTTREEQVAGSVAVCTGTEYGGVVCANDRQFGPVQPSCEHIFKVQDRRREGQNEIGSRSLCSISFTEKLAKTFLV